MEIQAAECCTGSQQCFLSDRKLGMETHQKQKKPQSVQIYIGFSY